MIYDLIIVGAGPGGLMAAATAAADGLKVLLLERKKSITDTPRSDVSIFYWKFILPDEYIEPINVTLGTGRPMLGPGTGIEVNTRFDFTGPGFSVDYTGPVIPYYNYLKLSPSGRKAFCIKDELWGFYFSREEMLRSLLCRVEKTHAEVMAGAYVTAIENIPQGARVRIRTEAGDQWFEARKVIAADGINSGVVESLGLNRERMGKTVGVAGYVLAGVEPEVNPHGTWMAFDVPSVNPGVIFMGLHAEGGDLNLRHLITDSVEGLERFMHSPRYAPWFRQAKVVRRTAFAGTIYQPLLARPLVGNVLVIGDAISTESFIQGALACGYQAAKATAREMGGQPGYEDYIGWLHKAFAFFATPGHFLEKNLRHVFRLAKPDDEDVEYVYRLIEERAGGVAHPGAFAVHNLELLKDARPEFHGRMVKAMAEIKSIAAHGGWLYKRS